MSEFDDPNNRGHLIKLDEDTFVERDVLGIIAQIQEYDPNLKVQYLAEAATLGDAPYRILELCKDQKWRVVFDVWKLDQRVVDRLKMADTHRTDVMSNLDGNNSAVKREAQRRFRDVVGEAGDITGHVLGSRKGRYTVDLGDRVLHVDDDPKPSWKVKPK